MAAGTSASAPPDLRREQMLRAAAELIGERGFSETRIADVARRAGASPALVIYYFGTKDQLLTEALRFSEDGVLRTRRRPSSSDAARPRGSGSSCSCAPPASRRARARSPAPGGCGSTCGPRRSGTPRSRRTGSSWTSAGATRSPQVVARRPGQRARSATSTPTRSRSRSRRCSTGCRSRSRCEDPVVDPDRAFAIAMAFAARELDVGVAAPARPRRSPAASGRSRAPLTTATAAAAHRRRAPSSGWLTSVVGEQPGRLRRERGVHRAARDERRRHRLADVGHRDQQGLPVRQPDDDVGASDRGRRPGPPRRGRRCAPAVRRPAGRSRST